MKIFSKREFFLILFIGIIITIIGTQSEYFFTLANLKGLFVVISVNSIIATGMTIVFIGGGFDISAGTHFGFLGIILGLLLASGFPILLAILLTLLVGIIDGLIIGILIAKIGINPFITTLGAMFIFGGASYLIGVSSPLALTKISASFGNFPESFNRIGGGSFHGIEYINIYMIGIVGILYIFSRKNVFFRQSNFVGEDEQKARLAGLKTNLITIFNFSLLSFLIAIAAILRVSRFANATAFSGGPVMGLTIIAAVILGGARLKGGAGSIIGSVLGVIMLATMNNGMVLLNISPFYSNIIIGLILLGAVLSDEFTTRRYKKATT